MEQYTVVGHRILVEVKPVETTYVTESGLEIVKPESTVRDEIGAVDRGVVVQVGPDAYNGFDSKWCKVGDTITWFRYAGRPVQGLYDQGPPRYHVLNDEDVLLRIEEVDG